MRNRNTLPLKFPFVFLILLVSIISCTDNFLVPVDSIPKDLGSVSSTTISANLAAPDPFLDSLLKPTILGIHLPNPYLLTNMKQAYKNITGNNSGVAVNNLYVRFQPTTVSQLVTLHETLDLDLTDVPMDYQILQLGNYYQDPSIPDEQITFQYAVVPVNFTFPSGIPYTILAYIHIPTDTRIEAEAERLAGLNSDGDNLNSGGAVAKVIITPNVPQCDVGYHWDYTLGVCVIDNCAPGYHWDTSTGTCVQDPLPPTQPGSVASGTIAVWDTQLGVFSGVRNVRVIAKRWFKVERITTDNLGRFTSSKKFRNTVKVVVKFKNNDSTIKGIKGIKIWQILFPLEFNFGSFSGSQINTVQLNFTHHDDVNSVGNLVWNAATVHNAVQEHKLYATQLRIGAPPSNLKIFLTKYNRSPGSASTPLFAKRAVYDVNTPFYKTYGFNYSAVIDATISQQLAGQLDIIYDYFMPGANTRASDAVASTIYHELGHAIHYNKLGNTWYTEFVNAELTENMNYFNGNTSPYGPGTNSSVSPIIALGEAWAYHVGHYIGDLKYGTSGSCQNEQGIARCNNNNVQHPHIDVLEQFDPALTIDVFRWIPKGLLLDLMDNTPGEAFGTSNPDQVSGYSNQQFYNALQSDVKSIGNFRDRLLQQNANNQQAQVINLVQFYGY